MARVDPDTNPAIYQPVVASRAILPLIPEDELETPPLPREHPKWVKDALAVSQRARQIVAQLRPVVIRVLTFWDHHVRGVVVGGQELTVDISGSYRIDY
ncbi:MAG TPA: hypothetical protein VFN37_06945 [Candidatus Baltobacteraceae bacterium]|nr:hypothetical protein [Candidatus Baltobacteraceae bacterium]